MANIPIDVACNLVQRLVDRAINEARYLCCFKSIVEDFEKEEGILSASIKSVGDDIKEARQRDETRIDHETQQWLKDANRVIEEDTKAKKKWFFGLCTNCIWQYGQGKELFQKTREIPKLIERRNNLVQVAHSAGPVMEFHCLSNFMHFESRKAKFEELKEALKNSNNHLVGLQGMGGTGKTTMATRVGKEVEESKLFDKVIFIVVSNPPDLKWIQDGIARDLGLPLEEGKKSEEHAESLWFRISNGGEKILIVLDDVWEKELDLKVIGIPVGLHDKGRCSVLLTTRDLKVCKAMGCQETIQVDVLPDEEALNLFLSHAVKYGVDCSSDFKDVALDIVKGCGGLPVAIEAIAKSIKSESLQVWKDTSTALQKFDPILYDADGGMKKAYNCLKLSYDNLKNEKAKKLFLVCSLFPEDFKIPVELLSRIAIGLGLFGEVDEYNRARRQVFDVKRKLVDSSLLLDDEEENVKMHDLVHEVATKIANKEIQVVRNSKTTLKENVRFSSWINGIPDRFNESKLEILIIFIKGFVEFPDSLFESMTKLRVLVIDSDMVMRRSVWVKSVQSLVNIRTLRLANLKLEDVRSMGNLKSLETLELFHCSIVELPNEITKLENLRLLGLSSCDIERNNPFEVIERCSRLQELYYTYNSDIVRRQLDDKEVCGIGIPRTLQMYDIIGEKRTFGWADKQASLLRLMVPTYFQNIFSEAAFKFLAAKAEILELHGDYGTEWTNLFPHIAPIEDGGMNDLIQLSLESFPKMQCLIHTKNIGSEVTIFAKLVELKLSTVSVKELCRGPFPNGFLKKLEKLYLYDCSNLEGTLFKGKLDLGKLKRIQLERCSMSSLFHPSTAQSLNQLKKLEISRCRELKNIITDEGLGEDKVENDPADPNEMCHGSMFSKLKFVTVQDCENVEDLPLLEVVRIFYCEKLKHIFGQHQHEGVSYQKGKEIKLPSLKEMSIDGVPNFINIFPAECCHHPMSTKDDLKVKEPSLSCSFSWALICCKSTATSIDNPIVSEEALQSCTGLQELKTQVFNLAKCFLRPPLDPCNLREITITHCSNFTWLFTLSIASSMPLLEELRVEKCNGLKHLFTNYRDDDDDDEKYSCIFPKLKVLDVLDCDLLESLFPASHFITLDLLEVLRISGTPKLRYVLGKCGCDDNLSHQESHIDVPNMELKIQVFNPAKCFLRPPLNPRKLRQMAITRCSNFTWLFTLSIASSMSLLESLEVEGCDGLKHIVTNEGDNGHDHMNYSSIFPNLKRISVKNCSFLEYIFPAYQCRSFNHLKSNNEVRYGEGTTSSTHSEPEIASLGPLTSTKIKERVEPSVREGLILPNEIMDSEPPFIPLRNESPQDKLLSKEAKNETITMEQAAPAEARLDMHSYDSQNNTEVNVGEDPLSEKYIKPTSETHSEPKISSPGPLTFTKNTEESIGEDPSSEIYIKPTSSTHSEPKILHKCQLSSTKESAGDGEALAESMSTIEAVGGVDKPLDNTQEVDDLTNECSSKERSNENALAILPPFVEMKDLAFNSVVTSLEDTSPLGLIIGNEAEIYLDEKVKVDHINPQQFEDDDLIRLLRTIEAGADIGVHKPYVSNIASLEDDTKVAKAFSDVEESLKMDVNEIANSEEKNIRLENALRFLSTHYSKDGAPSHILKDKIDSMHQEISSILSSFKQASARLSVIDTFAELEEKEKGIKEEIPQRKEAANTLISEICETKKSMAEAQKKEVELKEQIARLHAELNRKQKEIRDCEIKISSLEEQKKKSVWDTIGFLEECETVKKERSQIVEEKMKARQELEKVDVKWSSCKAKWWKTILLQEIHVKNKL